MIKPRKKLNSNIMSYLVLTGCLLMTAGRVRAEDPPAQLPAGFRFIGQYRLNSKIRVETGTAMAVVISPLRYRVYSDGIDVRVYCRTKGEESYTSYAIYRSDGVGVVQESGGIDVVAGVQAYCTKGEMIRQISVTRHSLTMVKMPPRSHRVLITRAKAIPDIPAAPSVKQPAIPQK
jgi:hypothetical protein